MALSHQSLGRRTRSAIWQRRADAALSIRKSQSL